MCVFSRPVAGVSATSIFARSDGDRQALAYQMRLSSAEDVAMVLPLPIALGHGTNAVEFVDLFEAPRLFGELSLCFWKPTRSLGTDLSVAAAGAAAPLEVHKVGAYDASFAPGIADFTRLDARFRIPDAVLDRVPTYSDYGFAVFKLRKGEADVHPLALRFVTRDPQRLFFPTVHVHHGDLPDEAAFDHTLYLQTAAREPANWEKASRSVANVMSLGNILHRDPTRGLIARDWPLYRLRITGMHPNHDTWVPS
jgi:hypothetical protein